MSDQAGSYHLTIVPHPGEAPILTGVNVPYSAEFRDRDTNIGLLENLVALRPEGGQAGRVGRSRSGPKPTSPSCWRSTPFAPICPRRSASRTSGRCCCCSRGGVSWPTCLCGAWRSPPTGSCPPVSWVAQRFRGSGAGRAGDGAAGAAAAARRPNWLRVSTSGERRRGLNRRSDDSAADQPPRDLDEVLKDADGRRLPAPRRKTTASTTTAISRKPIPTPHGCWRPSGRRARNRTNRRTREADDSRYWSVAASAQALCQLRSLPACAYELRSWRWFGRIRRAVRTIDFAGEEHP